MKSSIASSVPLVPSGDDPLETVSRSTAPSSLPVLSLVASIASSVPLISPGVHVLETINRKQLLPNLCW